MEIMQVLDVSSQRFLKFLEGNGIEEWAGQKGHGGKNLPNSKTKIKENQKAKLPSECRNEVKVSLPEGKFL